jgi:hypothetical protein
VVQWTTGIVGSCALRAIIDNPDLELVGVFAHSQDKVGRDAGMIAGRPTTGVLATDDVASLLATRPDCLIYMPQWPDVAALETILSAGINVVTTARLVNGDHYPEGAGQRLRAAAERGGVTLLGTGMNPMFVPTVALAATAMCQEVHRIVVTESLDCVMYGSAGTWESYGFGGPPDRDSIHDALWETEPDYRETLDVMATAVGHEIDEISLVVDCAVALADRDLGFMKIDSGTVAGIDATWIGKSKGRSVAEMRTVWTLGSLLGHQQEPAWTLLNGYRIQIDGEPQVKLLLSFRPGDLTNFDVGTTTAMPAVNAIPAVVAARPGVMSVADLPLITGRAGSPAQSTGHGLPT